VDLPNPTAETAVARSIGKLARQLPKSGARDPADDSDRRLLERFTADGDEEAFAALVRRHGRAVLAACRHVLADPADVDDAFQATFLTLLKKAERVNWADSLGNWLYAVAHRLAVRARSDARRRQDRESDAGTRKCAEAPPPDLSWREAIAVLHEELDRLPDRYRLPLLLCYLEGQSRDEAAKNLGWKPGAVKGCLERGRKLLAMRLVRRGITPSAGLLAVVTGISAATGGPAPELVRHTLQAAAGVLSPAVAGLVNGASRMTLTGKKAVAALVVVLGLVGAGLGLRSPETGAAQGAAPQAAPAQPAAKPAEAPTTVRGRALGTDGKPLAGAKLLVVAERKTTEAGTTGPDGRFEVARPKRLEYLVVVLDGGGMDFVSFDSRDADGRDPAEEVELRAVPDHPITGRVINTEGKPVVGARLTLHWVNVYRNDSLDEFLTSWKMRPYVPAVPAGVKHASGDLGGLAAATTTADGRFTVRGVGAERLVTFTVSGPGIATRTLWVVNRKGFDPEPYNEATRNTGREVRYVGYDQVLHGPEVSFVVEREKLVRGRVTDVDTREPRPGTVVSLWRDGNAVLADPLRATTDADGRYEIRGAKKAKTSYPLEVKSDPAAGYLAASAQADDTPGYEPVTLDVRVRKGVVITGRVVEKGTGRPVPGVVSTAVLAGNPFVKDFPEFAPATLEMAHTDADGTFRVVTVPGPVILLASPDIRWAPGGGRAGQRYKPAVPDPVYPKYFSKDRGATAQYSALGGTTAPLYGNFCKVLDSKPGTATVEADVIFEPASVLKVKVQDADGKPLAGAWATQVHSNPQAWNGAEECKTDEYVVYGVEPDRPRRMVFFEPKRKLVGTTTLKGDEKAPAVRLGPTGAVKGRLTNPDGKPAAGVVVHIDNQELTSASIHEWMNKTKQTVTDANGAFVLDGVVPGAEFHLSWHCDQKGEQPQKVQVTDKPVQVAPGKTTDLGNLKLTAPAPGGE
jgi:RNA polymerase sigma factor (sigma-70 family)